MAIIYNTMSSLLVDSHANYLYINPAQHDETHTTKKRKNFFFLFLGSCRMPVTCSDKIKAVRDAQALSLSLYDRWRSVACII